MNTQPSLELKPVVQTERIIIIVGFQGTLCDMILNSITM